MQRSIVGFDAFDRENLLSLNIVSQHRTGVIGYAVDEHGTSATFAAIAADFGACEIESVTKSVSECFGGWYVDAPSAAIDRE